MRQGNRFCAALGFATFTFGAHGAHAAERFADAGAFALSGERITGVVFSSNSYEQAGVTTTNKYTTIAFMGSAFGGLTNVYSLPRIAFDVFPIDHLSLGGSITLVHFSVSRKTESQGISAERDGGSVFGFLFSPRVGYALMFTPRVGLWPRAGVTYWSTRSADGDSATDDRETTSRWAITLEAPLVISPAPHTAIYVGPTLDLGIAGRDTSKLNSAETSVDRSGTDVGVQAGLGIYF